MDEDIDIKEELEVVEEEWDIKEETDQPLETQFTTTLLCHSKRALFSSTALEKLVQEHFSSNSVHFKLSKAPPIQYTFIIDQLKEANISYIEDENVPLASQPSWKREIDDEVNEELEQKFVCGFPSNEAETSSDVEELKPEESNPLLIDMSDEYATSSNQSNVSENLMGLEPLVVQATSLTSNELEVENLALANLKPAKMKKRFGRCPVCKEFLKSLADLKNHSVDHAEDWPYTCVKCNRVFIHRSSFHCHMWTQHGVNRSYDCEICNMTFKEALELHNHKVLHNRKTAYSCTICEKAFTRNYDCLLHMKNLHGILRPYKCSTCKETFRLRVDLEKHMSGHDKDYKFFCDICSRPFALRPRLIRHLVSHSNDRPYLCTVCNKSFKSRTALSGHSVWHTGERRYNCTMCGKAFFNTSCLKRHKLLHSEERQNICEVCGKSFRRNFYLRQHKLMHEKDLPSFAAI